MNTDSATHLEPVIETTLTSFDEDKGKIFFENLEKINK